jgi:hypothetical protein
MERIAIVGIVAALVVALTAAEATAEGDYKKVCRVSENLRVTRRQRRCKFMQANCGRLSGSRISDWVP